MSNFGKKIDIDLSKVKHEIYNGEKEPEEKSQNKINKYPEQNIKIDNSKIKKEAFIDKLLNEEDKDIGFDLKLLERDELNVNLIHFDYNMTDKENYKYYNYFKVNVVGGYQAIDDINFLKGYLEAIKDKNIPFIVISSGSSAKEVITICQEYPFVKEVIIFCGNYQKHEHYTKDYENYVKKVFISFKDVCDYIKTLGEDENLKYREGVKKYLFTYDDIQMNKQFEQCHVISASEYDKCYFLIHRAYAHFFGNMVSEKNTTFIKKYYDKVEKSIQNSSIIDQEYKKNLVSKFKSLVEKDNFVELAIRFYTGENSFCYILNRSMRNFESGLISLAYFMGPFLFGLNKYVKENPKFAMNKDMTLYRSIKCSVYDFYLYVLNKNHIICFPSFTSTSTVIGEFKPTSQSENINKIGVKCDELNVTMIFNYKHKDDNISPGIIIKNYKGKDGKGLSIHPTENEVILFPFTFVRITRFDCNSGPFKECEIEFDIINRNKYIEYLLRDDVEHRERFSPKDKIKQ